MPNLRVSYPRGYVEDALFSLINPVGMAGSGIKKSIDVVKHIVSKIRENPELVGAIVLGGKAQTLKLQFRGATVSPKQIRSLFPDFPANQVKVTKITPPKSVSKYTESRQLFDVNIVDELGNKTKLPDNILARFGLNKNFFYGSEPDLIEKQTQKVLSKPEGSK